METFPYKRIAVIGSPGSGKSTFSRSLRDTTGLPLYHLDALYWKPDRTTIPKEDFYILQKEILAKDFWIIDGNYGSTMEWRIAACELVIFLDYPVEVCLEGVASRRGQARSDIPWVEEGEDPEFLDFIRSFPTESRPHILLLLEKYPDKVVMRFTSRTEGDEFVKRLGQRQI